MGQGVFERKFMKIIVANWKMNGDIDLCDKIINSLKSAIYPESIIICPPSPLLFMFREVKFKYGAQNCSTNLKGAFTGEISPSLLKSIGCSYVIIGHSERRNLFCESNDYIFQKFKLILELDLIPIVCIGEKINERSYYKEVLEEQLKYFIKHGDLNKVIFAYEPVWSIGTGIIPNLDDILEVTSFIKMQTQSKVLYGGSVNKKNATEILNIASIDGALVGGASLDPNEFYEIIKISEKIK